MGGVSSQNSSGASYQTESQLSKAQAEILKTRESLFQDWYLPEFKSVMAEFDPSSESGKAAMQLTAKEINSGFDTAQRQTGQQLAKMNMLGTGAGAALTAANNRARATALSDAYANQRANSTANKAQMLNSMSGLMPSTSTAAPTLSFSNQKSSGTTVNVG